MSNVPVSTYNVRMVRPTISGTNVTVQAVATGQQLPRPALPLSRPVQMIPKVLLKCASREDKKTFTIRNINSSVVKTCESFKSLIRAQLGGEVVTLAINMVQWTLVYPDLDYPDPRLGSRTEIIARAYNDLRMRVVAVDKKIIVYMAAKSVVLSTEDRQVVGQGCLLLSSTRSSPCSQQLDLLAPFTATGKRIWPIIHLSGLFTYPACYFGQRGPDNRGSTVTAVVNMRTSDDLQEVWSNILKGFVV